MKFSKGEFASDNRGNDILEGEASIVFQVLSTLLWILESIHYPRSDNGVLECLIDSTFQIASQRMIGLNGRRCVDEVL